VGGDGNTREPVEHAKCDVRRVMHASVHPGQPHRHGDGQQGGDKQDPEQIPPRRQARMRPSPR
jgi:hypothetical protein